MRNWTRGIAAVVLGTSLSAAAAQPPGTPMTPPMTPGLVPPPMSVVPAPRPEIRPTGVAAVVNNQQIAEVAVYRALRQFPPAHQEMARKEILTHLIENILIDQYLTAIKITVEDKDVDALINDLKKELTDAKKDYAKELEAMMLTEAEFRAEVVAQMKWEKFVKQQGTDAALQQLFAGSPDVFDGTMVRARHILLTPGADQAKQQEAAQKLRAIKATVEAEAAKVVAALPPGSDDQAKLNASVKRTDELFAAYAKEYSVCPSKKDGGDLNYFPRAGAMVEPFAKAAFELKPFAMSDVVATDFGYHLIMVTDRKPGQPKKFEDVKEDVRMLFAMRLREAVIAQMKPRSQITITPVAAPAGTGVPMVPMGGIPMIPKM
jgi:peptidyl-prolyl cis-trans isomerase C